MYTRKGHLYNATGSEDFSGEPFPFKEQQEFMQREELKEFFSACFNAAD
ncbi:hypothetical protein J8I26_08835 [Herbaspirillum sp. LeCh32-8]|nr:hypothetical protein [Herbaspirillum sp. LeCh32-8]MBP0598205.1 hypothetical protein [Herbaspirillum sp. LeCh32-8]